MAVRLLPRRITLPLVASALIVGGVAACLHLGLIPPRYLPWAPIDLRDPPTLLTGWKLNALKAAPAACAAALAPLETLEARPVPPRRTDEGCGWEQALRLSADGVAYRPSVLLRCPMVAALAVFHRQAVAPAAATHLGQPVVAVRHIGSYACRPIRGERRLSEHAFANALDITGFELADGRVISVAEDWDGTNAFGARTQAARFLRAVRDGACRTFNVVLSPDRDRLHAGHIHLDMGPFRACD